VSSESGGIAGLVAGARSPVSELPAYVIAQVLGGVAGAANSVFCRAAGSGAETRGVGLESSSGFACRPAP